MWNRVRHQSNADNSASSLLLRLSFHGGGTPVFQEANCESDYFHFLCCLDSHIFRGWPSFSCIFMSIQWYSCEFLRFLMCAQIFMYVIAHRGCVYTIRVCTESWLQQKNPLPYQGDDPVWAAHHTWCLSKWATSQPCWQFWNERFIMFSVLYVQCYLTVLCS